MHVRIFSGVIVFILRVSNILLSSNPLHMRAKRTHALDRYL